MDEVAGVAVKASVRCAKVGGLNDESRTLIVVACVDGAAVTKWKLVLAGEERKVASVF